MLEQPSGARAAFVVMVAGQRPWGATWCDASTALEASLSAAEASRWTDARCRTAELKAKGTRSACAACGSILLSAAALCNIAVVVRR